MAKVVWSPRAIKDITEIAEYIAKDSLQYAKAQVRLFLEEGEGLQHHPFRGRVVPEIGLTNIRQVLCGLQRFAFPSITLVLLSTYFPGCRPAALRR
ncbi:type II toxin-antitoxin system RelE/ParE family toxin [Puia dinghuensis]|uniref:type II toxin-antitoxin system RelE/ParE family toxin n=1 Tax=Puia dinghuensis TaxID=1792502 RepID=UPI00166A786B